MSDELDDRELDALIAQKLFGWPPIPRECAPPAPRYSESWGAMRLVVEVMRARGYTCRIETGPLSDDYCEFTHVDTGRKAYCWAAIPRAVCLAALNALETEHKEEV